jgi:drug/metabolite transporter (DMT)-like permease
MTPLFGVGFGVWLLGEPLALRVALGPAGVTLGVGVARLDNITPNDHLFTY